MAHSRRPACRTARLVAGGDCGAWKATRTADTHRGPICGSRMAPRSGFPGPPAGPRGFALQALVALYAANRTIVDQAATRAAVTEVTDRIARGDHDDTVTTRAPARTRRPRRGTRNGAFIIPLHLQPT